MKRTTFDFPLELSRGAEPLRAQLIRALREAVQRGRLTPGSALPASRVLATDLRISRGLVVDAYEQLIAEGYFTARRGAATRVARDPRAGAGAARRREASKVFTQPNEPARFDFKPGVPDVRLFPARAWMRALRRAWADGSPMLLDYPEPRGVEATRIALAAYLNRSRATVADADRIVVCTGFAQAARIVCEVLRARGVRRVAVEDPGHAEQCADLRAAGVDLVPVAVDESGIVVERLARSDAGAVLVAPSHQYPTGAALAPSRRAALLEWAARRGAFVIEDDYDSEYRYDQEPIGSLQGLAPEQVVYVGTASKMLAPALRLGWLVLPRALVPEVVAAKLGADRGSPALEQRALAVFLETGELDRHLRRTRAIYRRRRDLLVAALRKHMPRASIRGIAAGSHILVHLPADWDEAALVEAALRGGIRVYPGALYHAKPKSAPPSILVGYGSVREEDIEPGITQLAQLFDTHSLNRQRQPVRSTQ